MSDPKSSRVSLWLVALVAVVLLFGVYFAGRSGTNANQYSNDFNVYYFAAREILDGRTPYENSLGEWTPYLYAPLLAELLLPLALLPLPVAAYVWFLINAAALAVALRLAAQLALQTDARSHSKQRAVRLEWAQRIGFRQGVVAGLTLLLLLRFTLDNFDYGQVNLLVTALAIAHIYLYTRGKLLAAALLLALAVVLKLTPAILLFYHLAKHRVRFLVASVVLIVGLGALSFAPFGSQTDDAFRTFFARTVKNEQQFDLAYHGNQSVWGGLERGVENQPLLALLSHKPMWFLVALLTFISVMYLAEYDASASAPFFCLAVLLSPLSWKQHYVILLLPLAYLLAQAWAEARPTVQGFLLAVLILVFALFNLTSPRLIGRTAAEWCDEHSFILIGGLLIFVACFTRLIPPARRAGSRGEEAGG